MKYKCSNDPNRNSVFLKLAGGTIFYDAKIDTDADGAELQRLILARLIKLIHRSDIH